MRAAKLVIFDCDGVLVDSERLIQEVDMAMIGRLGWPITRDEIFAEHLGRSEAAIIANIERRVGRPVPADFISAKAAAYDSILRSRLVAVAGVSEAITLLRSGGARLCVASSSGHARIRLSLDLTGLRTFFADDQIFSAEDVAHGKPAPDLFLLAASRMSTSAQRCVVAEDSPAGVAAAKAAGMRVVGYCGLTPAGLLGDADLLVSQMTDLPAAIAAL
ncbi:HAD family hydrolase [Cryptosporangium phraense]|uniref:HAD family hydrolase n=1 Tax=Cryptosporangium phraense TaxID=2593070 RepID=UPI00197ACD24|nr:HAD family phosphatase [Cryptosporangium phraense]